MTAPTARAMLVMAIAVSAALPAAAGDSPRSQARREMEIGYDAARSGYWQAALLRFERADSIDPGQPRILNNIAVALEATGQYEQALEAYERAVAAGPSDKVVRRNYKLFEAFYRKHIADTDGGAEADKEDEGESDDDRDE